MLKRIILACMLAAALVAVGLGDDKAVSDWAPLDPVTDKPASGSSEARRWLPGFVHTVRDENVTLVDVYLAETVEPAGRNTGISAYGRIRRTGEVIADHLADIAIGTVVDSGVLKNPGPYTLMVDMQTSDGPRIISLRPGWAIEIGLKRSDVLLATHEPGCVCWCDVPDDKEDEAEDELMAIACSAPDCDCNQFEEIACYLHDDDPSTDQLIKGDTRDCLHGLICSVDVGDDSGGE